MGFLYHPSWRSPQCPTLTFETVVSFHASHFAKADDIANNFMETHDYALLHIEKKERHTYYFMCHKDEHNPYAD